MDTPFYREGCESISDITYHEYSREGISPHHLDLICYYASSTICFSVHWSYSNDLACPNRVTLNLDNDNWSGTFKISYL